MPGNGIECGDWNRGGGGGVCLAKTWQRRAAVGAAAKASSVCAGNGLRGRAVKHTSGRGCLDGRARIHWAGIAG